MLNVPEPLKLPSLEEVEKHFRVTHKDTIIKSVESHTVAGVPSRSLRCRELQQLVRNDWEQQGYFPLQLATKLSHEFAAHGLQFFKVNKTVTHVGVARPQFLDLETTPVSENIKRIVGFINSNPKCTRRKLIEALAPSPAVIEIKPETPSAAAPTEGGTARSPAAPAEPTPEQNALIADLHWLIHQGHVLEFADGRMDTAKKPLPRPPKPEKKSAAAKPAAEGEAAATAESAPAAEGAVEPAPDISAPAEMVPEPVVETPAAGETSSSATVTPPNPEAPPSSGEVTSPS